MAAPTSTTRTVEPLTPREYYWRDHYTWLSEQGYDLRDRYKPEEAPPGRWIRDLGFEESWRYKVTEHINDAIRVSDNKHVVLKRVSKDEHPEEIKIMSYFGERDLASDPRNHCIPILDTLQPPDDEQYNIVVLPILREYDDPPFDTIGEGVDYIRQVLEGFAFLHEHRVAHRDIKGENILMDHEALGFPRFNFNRPYRTHDGTANAEPKHTRTERRPKYLIIDFGFSTQFAPEDMPPSIPPQPTTDLTLPELKTLDEPCNPFLSDVYLVGNMLRMEFIDGDPQRMKRRGFHGFEFLTPLIEAMTKENPKDRITMQEAVQQFENIIADLTVWKLRSRPEMKRHYYLQSRVYNSTRHWARWLKYTLQRLPPIPQASPDVQKP